MIIIVFITSTICINKTKNISLEYSEVYINFFFIYKYLSDYVKNINLQGNIYKNTKKKKNCQY